MPILYGKALDRWARLVANETSHSRIKEERDVVQQALKLGYMSAVADMMETKPKKRSTK